MTEIKVKFPENRAYKKSLEDGDYTLLSDLSKYTVGTVREVFNGNRRMTDKLKKALTKLLLDRKAIENKLKEAIKTNELNECSVCHSDKYDSSCSAE
ncbi:MAG: hypothetical protein ACOYMF_17435 [Bacteroidales bacterium]